MSRALTEDVNQLACLLPIPIIAKFLLRLDDVISGRILLDGHDFHHRRGRPMSTTEEKRCPVMMADRVQRMSA
ncbi:MAG: hypothetical protein ACRDTC_16025 [Pseudonocardiaceae bacterium]